MIKKSKNLILVVLVAVIVACTTAVISYAGNGELPTVPLPTSCKHTYSFTELDEDNSIYHYKCTKCGVEKTYTSQDLYNRWIKYYNATGTLSDTNKNYLDVVKDDVVNAKDYAKIINYYND